MFIFGGFTCMYVCMYVHIRTFIKVWVLHLCLPQLTCGPACSCTSIHVEMYMYCSCWVSIGLINKAPSVTGSVGTHASLSVPCVVNLLCLFMCVQGYTHTPIILLVCYCFSFHMYVPLPVCQYYYMYVRRCVSPTLYCAFIQTVLIESNTPCHTVF